MKKDEPWKFLLEETLTDDDLEPLRAPIQDLSFQIDYLHDTGCKWGDLQGIWAKLKTVKHITLFSWEDPATPTSRVIFINITYIPMKFP